METASMRDALVAVIEGTGAALPGDLDDDASLIRSGVLDSTALFDVILWIEERIAPGLDLTSFDLGEEWDTVNKILAFVARHRPQPSA